MAAATAPALEWQPARRSLMFTFGEYCFHETWCESPHVTRVKTSLDETTPTIIPLGNATPQYGLRRGDD
jgi:hypothetical protein